MSIERKLTKIIEELLKNDSQKDGQLEQINSITPEAQKNQDKAENIQISPSELLKAAEAYHTKFNPPGTTYSDTVQQFPPGRIWVKNNEVHVEGLPGKNTLPHIEPTENVNLYINGKLVKNKTPVSAYDYIYVDFRIDEEPLDIKIHKSRDNLTAYMYVKLQTVKKYSLQDQPPKHSIVFKTNANISKYLPLTLEDILAKIDKAGIKYGVDYHVIQDFIANPCDGKFEIARGIPPTASRDDVVDVLFPERIIKQEYSSKDRVDFFNLKSIPSVDENTLLAVKREGEMGQPGLSVTGDVILPREPKKIIIRAGKGVRLEENMVYSTTPGRPMVRKIGSVWLFYVEPSLTHYGNIDLAVGNQNFRGNIEVFGDVCDGMTIRAGGDINVLGCINKAKVVAMGSVCANKCIGAMVQAGGDSHYWGNCYFTLKALHTNLKSLEQAINVLLEQPTLKEFKTQMGLIFLLLIEKKFNIIPELLKAAVHFLEITPVDMPSEIKTLVAMIKEHVPPRNLTTEKVQKLIEYIEFAQEFFEQLRNDSSDAHINYALNSIIAATNDVHISGQGCFNSKITAGGRVYINGVIRGGEVNAKGDIIVEEAGSEIGAKTVLNTESGKIRILKKINDGVIVKVGGLTYKVTKTMGSVEFRNDSGEKVRVITGV